MVECIRCNRRWATIQPSCPWCGHLTVEVKTPISSTLLDSLKIGVALLLLGAAIILVVAIAVDLLTKKPKYPTADQSDPVNRTPPGPVNAGGAVANLTAKQLIAEFEASQVVAQQQYKGLAIKVRGQITGTGVDLMGNPYLVLDYGVQAVFTQRDAKRLQRFQKGETITAQCGNPTGNVYVVLTGCLF